MIENANVGSDFGAKLGVRSGLSARGLIRGYWGFQHLRPVNDKQLRRAKTLNEMQSFLAKCRSGRLGSRIMREVRRIGLVDCSLLDAQVWENIVVNVGLDHLLDVTLSGGSQDTTWFVGLKDTGTPVAADTMASHSSWATISPYSDGTDPAWADAGVSSQSVDNSASPAAFNINATDEIFGAFLKDNSTVDGATGILYAVGNFASSRNVENGDTLNVTATFTMADDGV